MRTSTRSEPHLTGGASQLTRNATCTTPSAVTVTVRTRGPSTTSQLSASPLSSTECAPAASPSNVTDPFVATALLSAGSPSTTAT